MGDFIIPSGSRPQKLENGVATGEGLRRKTRGAVPSSFVTTAGQSSRNKKTCARPSTLNFKFFLHQFSVSRVFSGQSRMEKYPFTHFALRVLREGENMMNIFRNSKKLQITLTLRFQKIQHYGWWTWQTLHSENQSFRQDRPQKFRLKYQGARDVILRKLIFSSRSRWALEGACGPSIEYPSTIPFTPHSRLTLSPLTRFT